MDSEMIQLPPERQRGKGYSFREVKIQSQVRHRRGARFLRRRGGGRERIEGRRVTPEGRDRAVSAAVADSLISLISF